MPNLMLHDRGKEFANAIMAEYCALVGIGRRLGTPYRPMEQGAVEGLHKETQKILGMLMQDVFKCLPNECGELIHVLEFVVYNTPGPHGYTPRDIDRRWSMSSPLERELQPFQISEFEPVDQYLRNIFRVYREVKVHVTRHMASKSLNRAELANRFRRQKILKKGNTVMLRDQRQRRAGG